MLIFNQAFLNHQPTGLSSYTLGVLPSLKPLEPLLLSATHYSGFAYHPVSSSLSIDRGRVGHIRRILWNQLCVPKIYRDYCSNLLFTPIPEAPLYSDVRFIVTVHDLIPLRFFNKNSPLYLYFKYFIPEVLNQAQHILCNSVATANDILDFFSIPASKVTPISLGYNASAFHFLNLPTQNYFLYVGRHDPYKNLSQLITSFRTVAARSSADLWIGGPFDARFTPMLKQQVSEAGLEQRVKFINYISPDELTVLLNKAIALVFPSLWEGFGLPILEAMACGTPVITSNVSALPEVARDAAVLFDPGDTRQLADAMKAVASSAEMRASLREAGLKRASQFSWMKTGDQTVEMLKKFL